ncbi:MAG TPA: MFS transporter [Aquihabitans sp.]|nr:MFS transporter [Aquihabitans sp.]
MDGNAAPELEAAGSGAGAVDRSTGGEHVDEAAFRQLVVNALLSNVAGTFLWFALTFWVYLETRSVVATGVIGGSYGLASAALGPWFGTYVDHHRKHAAMTVATTASTAFFAVAALVYVLVDTGPLLRLDRPWFWLLAFASLAGSVAGMGRSVALSTCVTMLVPPERRDKANGLVGTITGVSFAITSVFSGLAVGLAGMGWSLIITLAVTTAALVHLRTIHFTEPEPNPAEEGASRIDVRAAVEAIREVPGLWLLIALAALNNLLGGVFMALMDAYGLELVSVQAWGFLWGGLSLVMIAGGLVVARKGLGKSPLRLILVGNLICWIVCSVFTVRSSIVLLAIGMAVWLALMPMIEAAEQTVLQRVIPFERQGRVFGFAQLVENAASPITAIAVGPFAQEVMMPFMTDGAGADAIGSWYGTGSVRGLALMFSVAGVLGAIVTSVALVSKPYRRLRVAEAEAMAAEGDGTGDGPPPDALEVAGPPATPSTPAVSGAAGAPVPAG